MLNRQILKKYGCTAEEWRKKLEFPEEDIATPGTDISPDEQTQREKITELRRRIRSRVEAGRQQNLTGNYRTYQALDLLWSSAFRQVNPTIMMDFIRTYGEKSTDEITSALKNLGLDASGMWMDGPTVDPKTGKPIQILNVPVFTSVIIPLAAAYLLIRWAKLFNDRNIKPFHKIESLINSVEDRTRCEVLTARIQTMVEQYGMVDTFKQSGFMMLLYSQCMKFTLEEWHFEQQCKFASAADVERERAKTEAPPAPETKGDNSKPKDAPDSTYADTASGNGEAKKGPIKVGEEMEYTVREGLRYTLPHPSRYYWDVAHPQWTLNTDTGCEYAGYWRVLRWKEIRDNPDFYNKKRVSWGTSPWWETNLHFFNSVYNYCVMNWPSTPSVPETMTDSKDREAYLASNTLYSETHGEQSVVVTEHREKIIPKDVGLGTYPYPIWARFVVAGDGTIVYAAPCCYRPVTVYRDNGDDRRTQDASLALKLMGFQDQVSNLLTQSILAARSNLANFTMVDSNVVPPEEVKKIENLGERFIRKLNFFLFDGKLLQKFFGGAANQAKPFESFRFPHMDTGAIILQIKTIIDLTERVLQFSPQEVGQAASHEQTRAEMNLIQQSTTNVLKFTGHPVDSAQAAEAQQIYEALMAYGDDDFYASIPYEKKLTTEDLKRLGITYVAKPGYNDKRAFVRAKRSAFPLWAFARAPAPDERKDNIEAARLIAELVRDWFMNNPMGLSALGPDQLVELANYLAKLAGLPFERPLFNAGMTTEEQSRQAQAQLKAMVDNVLTDVKQALVPIMDDIALLKQATGISNDPRNPASPAGGAPPGQNPAPPSMAIPA